MKYTTHIDPDRREEVVIYAKEYTREIKALEAYVASMGNELWGFGEGGEAIRLIPSDVHCFAMEDGKVYALTDQEKFLIKLPLYAVEEALDESFVRINQSCLGNVKRIARFNTSIGGALMVTFRNGHRDYVSRRQLKIVKERMGITK